MSKTQNTRKPRNIDPMDNNHRLFNPSGEYLSSDDEIEFFDQSGDDSSEKSLLDYLQQV
jgi:hypothetical protein